MKLHLDTIPDEETALKCGGPALCGQRQLPPNVLNKVQDLGDGQQMVSIRIALFFFYSF